MANVVNIISNTTICPSYKLLTNCSDMEELIACGIFAAGEATLGTPYELMRVAGSEDLHTTVWFILDGEVVFEIPGKTLTAGPGMLLIHSSATNRRCVVKRGVFRQLFFHLSHCNIETAALTSTYSRELQELLRMLERENFNTSADTTRRRMLSALISSYLENEITCSPQPARVRKIIALIEENIDVNWTTESLAAKMNISPSLLYQLCIRHYGESPRNIIRRVKFRYASALLRQSDAKLDIIAAMIGYSSAFAFSKAFYKHTGKRPGHERFV